MTAHELFATLRSGTRALTMTVATIDPGAFHRLAGTPFSIAVTVGTSPRADFTIDGEPAPACAVEASMWPPGFGVAIGALASEVLGRQTDGVRRHAAAALKVGGVFVVRIDPDLWTFGLELSIGGQTIALGHLAPDVEGTC